jgi:hypothetical protein
VASEAGQVVPEPPPVEEEAPPGEAPGDGKERKEKSKKDKKEKKAGGKKWELLFTETK